MRRNRVAPAPGTEGEDEVEATRSERCTSNGSSCALSVIQLVATLTSAIGATEKQAPPVCPLGLPAVYSHLLRLPPLEGPEEGHSDLSRLLAGAAFERGGTRSQRLFQLYHQLLSSEAKKPSLEVRVAALRVLLLLSGQRKGAIETPTTETALEEEEDEGKSFLSQQKRHDHSSLTSCLVSLPSLAALPSTLHSRPSSRNSSIEEKLQPLPPLEVPLSWQDRRKLNKSLTGGLPPLPSLPPTLAPLSFLPDTTSETFSTSASSFALLSPSFLPTLNPSSLSKRNVPALTELMVFKSATYMLQGIESALFRWNKTNAHFYLTSSSESILFGQANCHDHHCLHRSSPLSRHNNSATFPLAYRVFIEEMMSQGTALRRLLNYCNDRVERGGLEETREQEEEEQEQNHQTRNATVEEGFRDALAQDLREAVVAPILRFATSSSIYNKTIVALHAYCMSYQPLLRFIYQDIFGQQNLPSLSSPLSSPLSPLSSEEDESVYVLRLPFASSARFISHLFELCMNIYYEGSAIQKVAWNLFWGAFRPYAMLLQQWLRHGRCLDPFQEFVFFRRTTSSVPIIKARKPIEDFIPCFMQSMYEELFQAGEHLAILQHEEQNEDVFDALQLFFHKTMNPPGEEKSPSSEGQAKKEAYPFLSPLPAISSPLSLPSSSSIDAGAVDTSRSFMSSWNKECVPAIHRRCAHLGRRVLQQFVFESNLLYHLDFLRHFVLMGNGSFFHDLTCVMSAKWPSISVLIQPTQLFRLNSIMNDLLESHSVKLSCETASTSSSSSCSFYLCKQPPSKTVHSSQLTHRLSLAFCAATSEPSATTEEATPPQQQPQSGTHPLVMRDRRKTDRLEWHYTVEWPLSAVFDAHTLDKHNRLFDTLLRLKSASVKLADTWRYLRTAPASQLLLPASHLRQEMNQFVCSFGSYLGEQLHLVRWPQLKASILCMDLNDGATDRGTGDRPPKLGLQELRRAIHVGYLDPLLSCFFLDRKGSAAQCIVDQLLELVHQLYHQVVVISSNTPTTSPQPLFKLRQQYRQSIILLVRFLHELESHHGGHALAATTGGTGIGSLLVRLDYSDFYRNMHTTTTRSIHPHNS